MEHPSEQVPSSGLPFEKQKKREKVIKILPPICAPQTKFCIVVWHLKLTDFLLIRH